MKVLITLHFYENAINAKKFNNIVFKEKTNDFIIFSFLLENIIHIHFSFLLFSTLHISVCLILSYLDNHQRL